VFGKLFADKGYISEKLTKILFVGDIHLPAGTFKTQVVRQFHLQHRSRTHRLLILSKKAFHSIPNNQSNQILAF